VLVSFDAPTIPFYRLIRRSDIEGVLAELAIYDLAQEQVTLACANSCQWT
jgi:hypothetical protein